MFQLLQSERLSLFAAALRVSFLLFESMRSHLKFQLEVSFVSTLSLKLASSDEIDNSFLTPSQP